MQLNLRAESINHMDELIQLIMPINAMHSINRKAYLIKHIAKCTARQEIPTIVNAMTALTMPPA